MGNFFEDYPVMQWSMYVSDDVVNKANEVLGFGYVILKWAWIIIFLFTLVSVIIALVRIAVYADDVPHKKSKAQHDLATSLVTLTIMVSCPAIFWAIITLLN